ncbi:MAG: prepilin-type N-terminal cleavage/methylation domain-containing protein [Sedimentisphaerales bacterium]|nr:prepilin-type N-terminal cleavage/methylation domain-containing protein [Sedimentisphaerales bacterium]
MKKAFTLIELLIVVSIIGILAAIVIPEFQNHSQQAAEAAAKDNLRIMREAIERYTVQHNGLAPGYFGGAIVDPQSLLITQLTAYTSITGNSAGVKSAEHYLGPYLTAIPKNSFNGNNAIVILSDVGTFPDPMPGDDGWYYKPATRQLRIDYPGTDSHNNPYSEY